MHTITAVCSPFYQILSQPDQLTSYLLSIHNKKAPFNIINKYKRKNTSQSLDNFFYFFKARKKPIEEKR
jgi:hypothetical protein